MTYRISYAPELLIENSKDILVRLTCEGSVIGIGYCDLLKSEMNNLSTLVPTTDSIYSMIHICDDYDIFSKINIDFGAKDTEIEYISIQIIGKHLKESPLLLYEYKKTNNDSSTNSSFIMPSIENDDEHKQSNDNDALPVQPPLKKRKSN